MTPPANDAVQVMTRFYRYLDDRDYARLTALMTHDGQWLRQGAILQGAEAITAALSKRSPAMRIHHLLTNVFAEPTEPDRATVTAYMLVVRDDTGGTQGGAAALRGIDNIRTVRATMRATPDGWRIEAMRGDPPSFAAK